MKRWLSIGLVLAMCIVLAACGGNNEGGDKAGNGNANGQGTDNSGLKEEQEIRVYHFKVELSEPFNEMTKAFEQEHPGIKIINDIVGGGADWKADLKTRFASGKGPDVFVVDGPAMLDLWKDRIVDLSGEPWAEHALPFAKEPATIDGKLYGMPYNIEGYGLLYNPSLFEQAGIKELPKTLSELREVAEQLQAAGITPFGNGYGEWWVLGMQQMNIPFAQQPDPDQFMQDLTTGAATMQGNDAFKDYQDFIDLTLEFGNANPLTTDYKTQETLFASGEVAMIHQGNWAEAPIRKINPDIDMDVMPVPINDDAEAMDRLEVGIPLLWVVNKESKHLEASTTFLNWMVSSDAGKRYLTEEFGFIPAYANIDPVGLDSVSKTVLSYSQADKAVPWSFTKWPEGAYNKFYAIVQGYIGEQYGYEDMLKQLDAAWNDLSK